MRKEKFFWTNEETLELWALLDHFRDEGAKSNKEKMSAIAAILKHKYNREYTSTVVGNKLTWEWKKINGNAAKRSKLFDRGSALLSSDVLFGEENEVKAIERARKRLQDEGFLEVRPQKRRATMVATQRLIAPSPCVRESRKSNDSSIDVAGRMFVHQTTTTTSPIRETEDEASRSSSDRLTTNSTIQHLDTPSKAASFTLPAITVPDEAIICSRSLECLNQMPHGTDRARLQTFPVQNSSTTDYGPSSQNLAQSITEKDKELARLSAIIESQQQTIRRQQMLLERSFETCDSRYGKLSHGKRDEMNMCRELDRKIVQLINEQELERKKWQRESESWSYAVLHGSKEDEVFKLREELANLEEKQMEYRQLFSFVRNDRTMAESSKLSDIHEKMDYLVRDVMILSNAFDGSTFRSRTPPPPNSDAEQLIRRVLTGVPRSLSPESFSVSTESLMNTVDSVKGSGLAAAVVSVAFQEWIFEADWPNFDPEKNELLDIYRDQQRQQADGLHLLRGRDCAAHRTLVERPGFTKHQLPSKAEELANRIKEALSTIFLWVEDEERLRELKRLIEDALNLKVLVLTGNITYSLLTVKPGTPFNPRVMHIDHDGSASAELAQNSAAVVKFCRFPALFVRKSAAPADVEEGHDMSRGLVSLQTFGPIGLDDVRNHDCLLKAKVLLG
ncbi:hypothetical protein NA57DRAFT_72549 [Rhizodiscina lignyota]|uniref:Uncharacterized protein n=1 Tax=Rhizodiscina lignyota TaxID=1504668 RepID=A0A9P4MAD9_9PEZI|nr:hypothetical protein NA57DRAFT_72549 [Rhizodiscina lignyota]